MAWVIPSDEWPSRDLPAGPVGAETGEVGRPPARRPGANPSLAARRPDPSATSDFAGAWSAFLIPPPAGGDQVLTLTVPASKFPDWTRGKTITITALTMLATSAHSGSFVAQPQAPLATADVTLTTVAGRPSRTSCRERSLRHRAVPARGR